MQIKIRKQMFRDLSDYKTIEKIFEEFDQYKLVGAKGTSWTHEGIFVIPSFVGELKIVKVKCDHLSTTEIGQSFSIIKILRIINNSTFIEAKQRLDILIQTEGLVEVFLAKE